jgi:hypothetical protein
LTNRQTEGFMRSLFAMMKIVLPVPDHSTLSKRGKHVKVGLPKKTHQRLNIVTPAPTAGAVWTARL